MKMCVTFIFWGNSIHLTSQYWPQWILLSSLFKEQYVGIDFIFHWFFVTTTMKSFNFHGNKTISTKNWHKHCHKCALRILNKCKLLSRNHMFVQPSVLIKIKTMSTPFTSDKGAFQPKIWFLFFPGNMNRTCNLVVPTISTFFKLC